MNSEDKKDLKEYIEGNVKAVWKSALDSIEMRFGKDFEGYKAMRARILRIGNDALRKIHARIDELPEDENSE
jgi:hypothetical protein